MWCRGIRGATTVETNTREEILSATRELLQKLVEANELVLDDVASAYFTTTADINAEFPAIAARQLGWSQVPLLCGHEMRVPDSLDHCIRVLLHVNTEKKASEIAHIYLKGAIGLRDPSKVPPIG